MVHVYSNQKERKDAISVYENLNLYDMPDILVPAGLSPAYLVHFFLMMMVNFIYVVIASRSIYSSKKNLDRAFMTQIDHLYRIMGLENEPYIVTKVVDEMVILPTVRKSNLAYRNEVTQELGYKVTYISVEF